MSENWQARAAAGGMNQPCAKIGEHYDSLMTQEFLRRLVESASGLGPLAAALTESGMKSVVEVFRGIPIFGSLSALSSAESERDETHYLLIPRLGDGTSFSIYSKRVLPEGIGAENSLPKARIFHVPDRSARSLLEQELVRKIVSDGISVAGPKSELADLLDRVADEIDRETNRVSGGLLLIGGVVALVNPLLGVGIAAKSVFPSLGAKVAKAGADLIGKKLRNWNHQRELASLEKVAKKDVERLQPELFENPILRTIHGLVSNPNPHEDPALNRSHWPDAFPNARSYSVTVEALGEVYRTEPESGNMRRLPKLQREWLGTLVSEPSNDR